MSRGKTEDFALLNLIIHKKLLAIFQKYLSKSKVIDGSAKAEAEKVVAKRTGIQWDPKPPSSEDREVLSREDA